MMFRPQQSIGALFVAFNVLVLAAFLSFWLPGFVENDLRYVHWARAIGGVYPFALVWAIDLGRFLPAAFVVACCLWVARLTCPRRIIAIQYLLISSVAWTYLAYVFLLVVGYYLAQQGYTMH